MEAKRSEAARRIFVRQLMTSPAIVVTAETPFKEIVKLLLEHNVTGLPVVDGEQRLLGIVTQADLLNKEAYGNQPRRPLPLVTDLLANRDPAWRVKAAALTAGDLMTTRVVTAAPGDDVRSAAHRMMEARSPGCPSSTAGGSSVSWPGRTSSRSSTARMPRCWPTCAPCSTTP